jgi:hypothetical protein
MANPCIVLQDLHTDAEFNQLMKIITPSADQFEHLYECWKNRKTPISFSPFAKDVLSDVQDHLQDHPSLVERAKAYHVISDIEQKIGNLDDLSAGIKTQSLLNQIREGADDANQVSVYFKISNWHNAIQAENKVNFKETFTNETRDFLADALDVRDPEEYLSRAYKNAITRKFETTVIQEYVRNPQFMHRPPTVGGLGDLDESAFKNSKLKEIVNQVFPKLSPEQQQNFIERSVLYDREFAQVLDEKHAKLILETLDHFPADFHQGELVQRMEEITRHYGKALQSPDLYPQTRAAVARFLKAHPDQKLESPALSLLTEKDANQLRSDTGIRRLMSDATHPLPEQLSKSDSKAFRLDQDDSHSCAVQVIQNILNHRN